MFNLITSALVITLPIPTLVKLKRHRPDVKQLLGLILLGLVHTGLTIARFVIMFYPDPLTKTEPQYAHIMPNCVAVVEMDIGIWVATLVVMRPAFQAMYYGLRPDRRPEGASTLYYGRSGSGKGGWYHVKERSRGNWTREDECQVLETTEIDVRSEGRRFVGSDDAEGRRFVGSDGENEGIWCEEMREMRQELPGRQLGARNSVMQAGLNEG